MTSPEPPYRKIIHVDMDAFYASVEQRDHPELRGKPIAVGGTGPRSVVATASYEARRFGVHSAMSSAEAKKRCPELIFVHSSMDYYRAVSLQIRDIFRRYTDLIEPLSIDEAYLDVTENKIGEPYAVEIAKRIKADIRNELHLVASAGVSYNKFLAKIASDWKKPDGLFVIHPSQALRFIEALPVEKIWGVGPATAKKFHAIGVATAGEVRQLSLSRLTDLFGKAGISYYRFVRGVDEREVTPEYVRKSVGCERTLETDVDKVRARALLIDIVQELVDRIRDKAFEGSHLTLKIRFADFTTVTRSLSANKTLSSFEDILPLAAKLLYALDIPKDGIRLIGVAVSVTDDELQAREVSQMTLF